jgi:drug/metabolite transporter (DMT)-like permease
MGKAYKYGDLGLAYPIVRSAPIFVLIVAVFFLNEQISTIGFIGIILIVLGTYVLNIESRKSILKIRKNLVKNKKVVFFGLLAALCSAGYTVVSKVGVTLEIEPFIIAYSMFFINILFFSPYILKNRKLIKKELKMNKFSLMAVGILMAFSWIVVLYTLQLTNVSYIASLRQLSLIFGVIFGGIFLKEKKMTIRLTGATLIIIGSILIAMAI